MTQQPRAEVPALTLGWRLKMALEHGRVSRAEMADELGVDPATITRWTGDRGAAPKAGFLKQWALRCGVPYEWLVTGATPSGLDGEPTVPKPARSPGWVNASTAVLGRTA